MEDSIWNTTKAILVFESLSRLTEDVIAIPKIPCRSSEAVYVEWFEKGALVILPDNVFLHVSFDENSVAQHLRCCGTR